MQATVVQTRACNRLGLVGGAVLVLLVGVLPAGRLAFVAPKVVGLAALGLLGAYRVPGVVRAIWTRPAAGRQAAGRPAVVGALGLVGVALASSALAGFTWAGLGLVLALVGCWFAGAALGVNGVRSVRSALLWGLYFNLAVSGVGLVVGLSWLQPRRADGRLYGLLGNPVWFGAVVAAGLVLLVRPVLGRELRAVAALAVGLGCDLSGSRSAVLAVGLVVVVLIVRLRSWLVSTATVAGLLVGAVVGPVLGSTAGGVGRELAAPGVGAPRRAVWAAGLRAVEDRPAFGAGPGRFLAATSGYQAAAIRAEGAGEAFSSAHSWVVDDAASFGLVGLACVLVLFGSSIFVAATSRQPAGDERLELVAVAVVLLLVHLVEPEWYGTTPVAYLCLGAGVGR